MPESPIRQSGCPFLIHSQLASVLMVAGSMFGLASKSKVVEGSQRLLHRESGGRCWAGGRPGHRHVGCRFVLGLGGFAGLQGDRVRGQCPGPQGGREPATRCSRAMCRPSSSTSIRARVPSASPWALTAARPPGVVGRGELSCGSGLFQSGRAGEGPRLADQGFEVVVQIQAATALGCRRSASGNHLGVDEAVRVADLLFPGVDVEVERLILTDVEICVAPRSRAASAACSQRAPTGGCPAW